MAIVVGSYVRSKANGRAGKVMMLHEDDLPYKVAFLDPHVLPHSDWFAKDAIELCHETAKKVEEEEKAKAKQAEEELAQKKAAEEAAAKKKSRRRGCSGSCKEKGGRRRSSG